MKQVNNTGPLYAASMELMAAAADITGATIVDITDGPSHGGKRVIWVNVDGICMLRVCQAKKVVMPNVEGALKPIVAKLKEMKRGTFDTNPTRFLPSCKTSAEVDTWWLEYFQRSQKWQREQAEAIIALLSTLVDVEDK